MRCVQLCGLDAHAHVQVGGLFLTIKLDAGTGETGDSGCMRCVQLCGLDAHAHVQVGGLFLTIKLDAGTGETGDSGCVHAGEASCVAGWDDIDDILGY